jgi:hypothetical protein
MHSNTLLQNLRFERVNDLADEIIRVFGAYQLWFEFILSDFHPLNLVNVLEPHGLP